MNRKKIPISELKVGRWYIGRGRNSNIAFWNGEDFLTISKKMKDWVIKAEPYYTELDGCFQPFKEINEGIVIKSVGKDGWDKHYAELMNFDS